MKALPRPRVSSPADLSAALGIEFSKEQIAAITAPLAPGVIIAGAGSGKTTVMAARVVWLVGTGQVQPDQVLGLTFTRKAAREFAERVRGALARAEVGAADQAAEQVIMTYDAFAGRLLSEHGLRLGFEGDQTLLTGASRWRVASRVVSVARGPFEHLSRLRPDGVTGRVLGLDAELASHLAAESALIPHAERVARELAQAPLSRLGRPYEAVKEAANTLAERLELAGLARAYAHEKLRRGAVEFADQMVLAARLAEELPEVGAALRDQFRVVLLDEYQDTSAAQARLLRGLFSGPAGSGLGHPVTAVGDPFQAIYGWRGAAASNILQFAEHFPDEQGGGAPAFPLTVNRRSGPSILAAANALAEPLRADPSLAFDLSGASLRAPAGTAPGRIDVADFETWTEEVDWVADQVVAAHQRGEVQNWSDVAVLLRRNADIAWIYAALRERDVPAEIVGLGGLLQLPEVADVVATLRLIDDPTRDQDVIRLLTGPRWAVGRGDLELLGRRARELAGNVWAQAEETDLAEAMATAVAGTDPTEVPCLADAVADPGELRYSEEARQRFAEFEHELAGLRGHSADPVLDLIRRVVATTGLDAELAAKGEGAEQLAAFQAAVAAYVDVDQDGTLRGLLEYLRAEEEHGTGLDVAVLRAGDAVQLLTVHKAKGLEWEMVFLPALVAGVFPSDRVTDNWVKNSAVLPADLRGDAAAIPQLGLATEANMKRYEDQLAEQNRRAEDRLAYVAVTRAKRVLVATGHTWRPDRARPFARSDYLQVLWGEAALSGRVLAEAPPAAPVNPIESRVLPVEWPAAPDPEALQQRLRAAEAVNIAIAALRAGKTPEEPLLGHDDAARVAEWDRLLSSLLAEAESQAAVREVLLPPQLSATALVKARSDPEAYARQLARPMPQPPSRSASLGIRFHDWMLRRFEQAALPDLEDLPDAVDFGWEDDEALDRLIAAFEASEFAALTPVAAEFPFSLMLGGNVVRGRIDAVYGAGPLTPAGASYLIVDWKTGDGADELQLAIYRVAWAELHGIPVDRIAAGFFHVSSGELRLVDDLPTRAELEGLLVGLSG